MQLQHLSDLCKEFKRFSAFMNPDSVRSSSSEAVSILSNPESVCLPIDSAQSPIILAFCEIIDNKKTIKSSSPMISVVCSCVSCAIFTGDALSTVIYRLERDHSIIDPDAALKIIQLSTTVADSIFLDIPVFQSLLSLVLSFAGSPDQFISTNAYAASEQIIDSFIEFASRKTTIPTSQSIVEIASIEEKFSPELSSKLKAPLYKVVFFIISDLLRICKNQPPIWLRIVELKASRAFPLFQSISIRHSELMNGNAAFLDRVNNIIRISIELFPSLDYVVQFVDTYLESLPETVAFVFQSYFSKEQKYSFCFFRTFIFRPSNSFQRFLEFCPNSEDLLSHLFSYLRSGFDSSLKDTPLDLSLASKGFSISQISSSAPIEITAFVIQVLYKTPHKSQKYVPRILDSAIQILTNALPIVADHRPIIQTLYYLISLCSELSIEKSSLVSAICLPLTDSKMSHISPLVKITLETLTTIIESTPTAFNGHWPNVVGALSKYKWKPNSYNFSKSLDDDAVIELATSFLITNNSQDSTNIQWFFDTFISIITSNTHRLPIMLSSLQIPLFSSLVDTASEEPAISAYSSIVLPNFSKTTELQICDSIKFLVLKKSELSAKIRSKLLDIIRSILISYSESLSEGWTPILCSLSPTNFADQKSLIPESFSSLQLICNDLVYRLGSSQQNACIDLIFSFARQPFDPSVSLLSLPLLWHVVPLISSEDMWVKVFQSISSLIPDDRYEISRCAVDTFFSLILSNNQKLSQAVFTYVGNDIFSAIIKTISSFKEENASAQQLAFYELAHCSRSLWDQFSCVEWFRSEMWHELIQMHEKFMEWSQKRDIIVAAFQFYEEVFGCEKISEEIYRETLDSLDRLSQFFIKKESANSSVYGAVGRFIRIVLPTQKSKLNGEILNRWLSFIDSFIFDLKCDDFLPPTVHKSLDAIDQIFPLSDKDTKNVFELLIKCASFKANPRLIEVAMEHICFACEQCVPDSQLTLCFSLCEPLFDEKTNSGLLLSFVGRNTRISDEVVDDVCSSIISLGEKKPELREKVEASVLKLFPQASESVRKLFIQQNRANFECLRDVWARFCDPSSKEFDKGIALSISREVLNYISSLLSSCGDDSEMTAILNFLLTSSSFGEVFGEGISTKRHLFFILPVLADLVIHPNEEVRKVLRDILIIIASNE